MGSVLDVVVAVGVEFEFGDKSAGSGGDEDVAGDREDRDGVVVAAPDADVAGSSGKPGQAPMEPDPVSRMVSVG